MAPANCHSEEVTKKHLPRKFALSRKLIWAGEEPMIADEDFAAQCGRQLKRTLNDRIRFGFFRNPDPVRDQGTNRSFSSMEEYRRFCEEHYPEHFGYRRASVSNAPQP